MANSAHAEVLRGVDGLTTKTACVHASIGSLNRMNRPNTHGNTAGREILSRGKHKGKVRKEHDSSGSVDVTSDAGDARTPAATSNDEQQALSGRDKTPRKLSMLVSVARRTRACILHSVHKISHDLICSNTAHWYCWSKTARLRTLIHWVALTPVQTWTQCPILLAHLWILDASQRDYSKGHSQRLACAAARLGRLSSVTGTIHRNVIATTGEPNSARTYVCHLPLVGTEGHMMGRRDSPSHCRHDSLPHRSHMNETENGDVESHMPTGLSEQVYLVILGQESGIQQRRRESNYMNE
ncbi:hypothetical protein BKA82DRAFT_4342252 [Pisolithus tinctorius]|nr:hypothetical protein BKA82DRAFT_4342252 [Pisolithus tinctorius]